MFMLQITYTFMAMTQSYFFLFFAGDQVNPSYDHHEAEGIVCKGALRFLFQLWFPQNCVQGCTLMWSAR